MMISDNFHREEFKCKCSKCNCDTVDIELVKILEDIRKHFNRPVKINSGHRCNKYNKSVGGSSKSQHLYGRAADIVINGVDPYEIYCYLDECYPDSLGLGSYVNFTHVDTRTVKARW